MKSLSKIFTIGFFIFCLTVLFLSVKGNAGNPTSADINTPHWKEDGPFELSPDRGRFALMLSLVENNSFHFSLPIARFATPDLGYFDGKYVSLFAPGVSFLILPGYLIGEQLGAAQVGVFLVISLFAFFNVLLIRAIAMRLGAHWAAALIGGLIFVFATPAFSYAVSLYQHHISTFLILSSIYLLLRYRSLWSVAAIWFLFACSIPIDNPNLLLMAPIALAASAKIIWIKSEERSFSLNIRMAGFLTLAAGLLPLLFFFWYNTQAYGNPTQLAGTLASVKEIDESGRPSAPKVGGPEDLEKFRDPAKQEKSAVRFFQTRNLLNGFYIHFISPDRGILFFTPVILLGFLGMIPLYRRNPQVLTLLSGILGVTVLLYSMWGDPWGGWAFGSRYMIPSYAILSIFLAVALSLWKRHYVMLIIFLILAMYSLSVNTLGALTSNRNPPQIEVLSLEKISGVEQKYTYTRNLDFINSNSSKSFVFREFAGRYLSAWQYYQILAISLFWCIGLLLLALWFSPKRETV